MNGVGSELTTTSDLDVGANLGGFGFGVGRLNISNGGLVDVGGAVTLADTDRQAVVAVDGVGSTLRVGAFFDTRDSIGSSVRITNGGAVLSSGSYFSGPTEVSGLGSLLWVERDLILRSELRINDQAMVRADGLGIAQTTNRFRIALDQGTLAVDSFQNGGGTISGTGTVVYVAGDAANFARIQAGVGDNLLIRPEFSNSQASFSNRGDIHVEGGVLEIGSRVVNGSLQPGVGTGKIVLRDGQARFSLGGDSFPPVALENRGLVAATGGVNDLFGEVRNDFGGKITATNNSTLIFHDEVLNLDGAEIGVMPGSTAVFLGGLQMAPGSVFLADIAGTSDDTGFGTAEVVGPAMVDGVVSAALAGGFEPSVGDSFTLLTASGGITGSPELGDVPGLLPGLAWALSVEANALVLDVISGVPGDANGDTLVNAADYVALRDFGGPDIAGALAEWRSNFGTQVGVVGDADAVPEPAGAALISAAIAAWGPRRRASRGPRGRVTRA